MKISFITPRFPYPVNKGDTLRAYHQIRELSQNHRVHLTSLSAAPVAAPAITEMQQYCERIDIVAAPPARSFANVAAIGPASRLPLQVLYFRSADLAEGVRRRHAVERYDIVHAVTMRVAPAALPLRHSVPIVVDFLDSYAANIASRRALLGPLMQIVYGLELRRVQAYERELASGIAGGVVVAELDRATIANPALTVIPNGVDAAAFPFFAGEREPATLIFTGNMGYGPNIDAAVWFATHCWPKLRAAWPSLRFEIVGARPAPAVSALRRIPGIVVTGRVDSMVPYMRRATVAVCPIRCGSGMQNKLLEAMSSGVPVVTTEFANRGIGAIAGCHVAVGVDADTLVAAVLGLLGDRRRRYMQAEAARLWVEQNYSWTAHGKALVDVYERARATG